MGRIIVQEETTKDPVSLIGREAGVCWGADITSAKKNYKRGLGCLTSGHGRTWEYPQVYVVLDGYSARVIRELYTHIAGGPTRLQASTRYINYEKGFDYVIPPHIENNAEAKEAYITAMADITAALQKLEGCGILSGGSGRDLHGSGSAACAVAAYKLQRVRGIAQHKAGCADIAVLG